MFIRRSPEVLVVGAGPVGLTTALALARCGTRVEIVDRDWRTGAHSYALALHARGLELFDELGLRKPILEQAYRVRKVAIFDRRGRRAELRLSEDDDRTALAVLRQDALESLLEKALQAAGVSVRWNHEVIRLAPGDAEVAVHIDKLEKQSAGYAVAHTEWIVAGSETREVPFVIGTDGHQSTIRRQMGIDYPQVGPPLAFAVFEGRTDLDLDHEMRLVLDDDGLAVLWPLPGGFCRWSFLLGPADGPLTTPVKDRLPLALGSERYPVLAEESFERFVDRYAPWFTGRMEAIAWRIAVRFEPRLATSFGRGRVWLAGDAGHTTGPAGMQSMNVGLEEGCQLAAIISGILEHREIRQRLVEYADARQAQWQRLLGMAGRLQPKAGVDPWLAVQAERLLPCLPASGPELDRLAEQLGFAPAWAPQAATVAVGAG